MPERSTITISSATWSRRAAACACPAPTDQACGGTTPGDAWCERRHLRSASGGTRMGLAAVETACHGSGCGVATGCRRHAAGAEMLAKDRERWCRMMGCTPFSDGVIWGWWQVGADATAAVPVPCGNVAPRCPCRRQTKRHLLVAVAETHGLSLVRHHVLMPKLVNRRAAAEGYGTL